MLEHGVSSPYNSEYGHLDEAGAYPCTSGIKYRIDTSIESTVQKDASGGWLGGPTGEYRVNSVEIYDKESNSYKPLDLNKTYKVASTLYMFKGLGNGYNMLATVPNHSYINKNAEMWQFLSEYVSNFTQKDVQNSNTQMSYITSAGSPIYTKLGFSNFSLNYENPNGAGNVIYGKASPVTPGEDAEIGSVAKTADYNMYMI